MKLLFPVSRIVVLVVLGASMSSFSAVGNDEPIDPAPAVQQQIEGVSIVRDQATTRVSPRISEAIAHVARCEVKLANETPTKVLQACKHPLLSFGDPARDNEAGTLWAWSDGGRPFAMMELYRPGDEEAIWVHLRLFASEARSCIWS